MTTTLRSYRSPMRLAKMPRPDNTLCWQSRGNGNAQPSAPGVRNGATPRDGNWAISNNTCDTFTFDTANSLLGTHPENFDTSVCGSVRFKADGKNGCTRRTMPEPTDNHNTLPHPQREKQNNLNLNQIKPLKRQLHQFAEIAGGTVRI